jgi:Spy/CpxP family protein refolding chaperone
MRFFLALILLTLPLAAQEGRYWPRWNPNVMKELNLTDIQSREVRSVIQSYRTRLIDLKAATDKAEAGVEDAFNEDSFDSRRATDAYEKVISTRAELARVFCQMNTKLRAVLTADQWRDLQRRNAASKASPAPAPQQ